MLIGFTGVIGAGKTYSATVIRDYFNCCNFEYKLEIGHKSRAEIYSFGGIMKNIAKLIYPSWGEEHVKGKLKEVVDPKYGVSPRRVLQVIGKGLLDINENIWVDHLFNKLERLDINWHDPSTLIAIDDVRYSHDFEAIKQRHGIMIGIIPTKKKDLSDEVVSHDTEKYINDLINICDYTFVNDYGRGHHDQIKEFAHKLYKGDIE